MIYVVEFSNFVKVGKTQNFAERLSSLENEYKEKSKSHWVSSSIKNSDEAEVIAHRNLCKFLISGEKFSCSIADAIDGCMNAISRSESLVVGGSICGVDVMVDPGTGYIEATRFKKEFSYGLAIHQFLKSESVRYINEEIELRSGMKSHYTCKGRNARTFVHPYVFIEMLRSMSAKIKLEVYLWAINEMVSIEPIRKCLENTMNNNDEAVRLAILKAIK